MNGKLQSRLLNFQTLYRFFNLLYARTRVLTLPWQILTLNLWISGDFECPFPGKRDLWRRRKEGQYKSTYAAAVPLSRRVVGESIQTRIVMISKARFLHWTYKYLYQYCMYKNISSPTTVNTYTNSKWDKKCNTKSQRLALNLYQYEIRMKVVMFFLKILWIRSSNLYSIQRGKLS